MPRPWRSLAKPEDVDVVAPDGSVRCRVTAYYAGTMFTVEDMTADIQPGDEIRRLLPNKKEDVFNVDDPQFFNAGGFGPHYQIKVSRKGTFLRHTSGNYTITVSGTNSRVNINSSDNSTNTSLTGDIFNDLRRAVECGVPDASTRKAIIKNIDEAEKMNGRDGFLQAYQAIISSAANHMTIVSPFLPALTKLLG